MRRFALVEGIFACAAAVFVLDAAATVAGPVRQAPTPRTWRATSSDNFDVYGAASEVSLAELARRLEQWRRELGLKWLRHAAPSGWTPRCAVVLHPSKESYSRAVPGGDFTAGSSLFEVRGETVEVRRIDVLPAPFDDLQGTLAHELMHILIGEHFKGRPAPAWAEEGIAVFEDSADCRRRHRTNLLRAASQGRTLPLPRLFDSGPVPARGLEPLFYGQSASLAEFLVDQASPHAFIRFIEQVQAHGYDSALREVYDIENTEELQRKWGRALGRFSAIGWSRGGRE